MDEETGVLPVVGIDAEAILNAFSKEKCVYASLGFESRQFGDKEEGGWWHDTCDVLYQAPAFSLFSVATLMPEDRKIESNDGRYSICSVCPRGVFAIRVSTVPLESNLTQAAQYS
jgi:hypothetical protein